jgi:hypothetical protein
MPTKNVATKYADETERRKTIPQKRDMLNRDPVQEPRQPL